MLTERSAISFLIVFIFFATWILVMTMVRLMFPTLYDITLLQSAVFFSFGGGLAFTLQI